MTGDEYNQRQIRLRMIVMAMELCSGIGLCVVGMMARDIDARIQGPIVTALLSCLILVPFALVLLRQKCPFCSRTLSSGWDLSNLGEYCQHCGKKFSDEIATVNSTERYSEKPQGTDR